jgi:predicted Abi (CAAX) family protease
VTPRADPLQRLEVSLGRLLQAGVLSSAFCLAAGLALWMLRGPSPLSSRALTVGLVILMATPIMRVLVSLVAYVRMRDWFFVATTVLVFVLLAVTVTLAWAKAV